MEHISHFITARNANLPILGLNRLTVILYTNNYKESPLLHSDECITRINDDWRHYGCFIRFLGGPRGGLCWLARARKASAIRWGWLVIKVFQPCVSITSVAWLKENIHRKIMKWSSLDPTKLIYSTIIGLICWQKRILLSFKSILHSLGSITTWKEPKLHIRD